MAERGGAAIDVDLVVRNAEVVHRDHRDAGERLVDLEQVDIVFRPAGLGHHLLQRRDGGGGELGRLVGVGGVGDDPRDRGQAELVGDALPGQHQRGGAVRNRRGVGGGDRAVLGEGGLQRRDFGGVGLARLLVDRDDLIPLAARDGDRDDLALERAAVDRGVGATQALDRIAVLILAAELIVARRFLGEAAHQAAGLVGVLKPVQEHMILEHVMTDARATAMLVAQIRSVGHRLHAAGDDHIGAARSERIGGHDRRLHPRSAHLVDRGRFDRTGQPGTERCLPRGRLAEPGGEDAAHVDFVDPVAVDPGAFDRRLDRRRAKLGRRCARQRALEPAHRRARIGQDDDRVGVAHALAPDGVMDGT